jgi:hypothetical protein
MRLYKKENLLLRQELFRPSASQISDDGIGVTQDWFVEHGSDRAHEEFIGCEEEWVNGCLAESGAERGDNKE